MKKNRALLFAGFIALTATSGVLAGCNTIEGAGKDVSSAGHTVTEEAKEHK